MATGKIENVVPNTLVADTYTPVFSYSSSGQTLTVGNIDARYFLFGGHVCVVTMRFNITNLGTHGDSENLQISLPSNVNLPSGTVSPIGVYYAPNGISNFILRASTYGFLNIVNGMGGSYSAPALTTGYQGLFVVIVF